MKTLDEIIETILNDKRVTKQEVKKLFEAHLITCLKLTDAENKIKSLEKKTKS